MKIKLIELFADSGFANLLIQYRFVMQYRYHKPWWLISFGLARTCQKFTNSQIKEYNLLSNSNLQVPVLLIIAKQILLCSFYELRNLSATIKK